MDFLKSRSVGIEVAHSGIAAVLMHGNAESPVLDFTSYRSIPHDMLKITHRELHVQKPDQFGRLLYDAWSALDVKDARVSLSLPDSAGRIMLLDIEERWKNKEEAVDMIRWKLKKSLPLEMSDLHLDFQVLERREEGETSIMAAVISRKVVKQYEDILEGAGIQADCIEFTSVSILKAFNQIMNRAPNSALFTFYDSTLGVMFFYDGVPSFFRFKSLPATSASSSRVYMEVNNSLVAYRQRWPERLPGRIICLAPPESADEFRSIISELSGQESQLLEIRHIIRPGSLAPAEQAALFPFTSAIGAAMGRL